LYKKIYFLSIKTFTISFFCLCPSSYLQVSLNLSAEDGGGMVFHLMSGGHHYFAFPPMKPQNEQFSEQYLPTSEYLPKPL